MEDTAYRAVAIVGVGAILPDAPNAPAFWENVKQGRYSVTEVAPDRWDPALYYDSDPDAPDKTYSKIGGWVREYEWDPLKWRLAIPPRVVEAMDDAQKWAVACTREALNDYGYPARPLDSDRTAVILGSAIGGEHHYLTILRIYFPEYARELANSASFATLPAAVRRDITHELQQRIARLLPEITEDTMPGELANCTAGRVANLFNFRGPNFTTDAACASAMAAIRTAVEGLIEHEFDVALTGGVDRNMGASSFIKFCKIHALSATGTRPYAEGADGFVMGEGAGVFLLKRLADAERDKDKIYAIVRSIGASSDGKGKGITAPNPIGQKLCVQRAWENAGLSPATVTLIEGHGTSTSVGDVVEAQNMVELLRGFNLPAGSVALGSVKSNFGHLKAAAGSAGLLKATFALRDKVLPPSLHCEHPNPNIGFDHSPLYVNTELRPWPMPTDGVRRAGASAFGFGGTNFHVVLEEYIPHRLNGNGNGKRSVAVRDRELSGGNGDISATDASRTPLDGSSWAPSGVISPMQSHGDDGHGAKAPLRGALVIGAFSEAALAERLRSVQKAVEAGRAPSLAAPVESDLLAPERIVIDYADAADLVEKSSKALKGLAANQAATWKALRAQGVFRGHGPAPKVAFLYTGQGSQYANMLRELRATEPIVAKTFAEADRVMTPLLGKPLSDFVFVDQADAKAVAKAEEDLRQTEITQPTVLAIDMAMTRLLAAYGIQPDMTMGHSLGEYGALVAAGALPFEEALEAVSARGRGMAEVAGEDNGRMAAVFAPLEEIEKLLKTIDGYVVVANFNSNSQGVIGGASKAVAQAMEAFLRAGYNVVPLPVSHAFHTSIVAPASEPLQRVLEHLHLESPRIPTVANVNGEFYPTGPGVVPQMVDILARQVASPVQFVKGLQTLYDAGARVFVEVGPKKALQGFAEDVLGERGDAVAIFTNHPKLGDVVAFNQALCSLYAAGLGHGTAKALHDSTARTVAVSAPLPAFTPQATLPVATVAAGSCVPVAPADTNREMALGRLFAEVLDRGWKIYHAGNGSVRSQPVTITGAALGLPGTERIFDDTNVSRILRGDQFIDVIPMRFRRDILDKHITRLSKNGGVQPTFESIDNLADVIKLAGRGGAFDLAKEFGIPVDRVAAFDRNASLAIAAGIDALRDAGIPLILRYKTTSKNTQLPERWGLPDALRDETGVIFASVYPGLDSLTQECAKYYEDRSRREQLALLKNLRERINGSNGESRLAAEIESSMDELRAAIDAQPYVFDRQFLFRVISMAHAQFAELIGARGPNTQVNAACASTTQAVALAEDWIRTGRCRRVVVVSADDITSDSMIGWLGAGFLSTGAAATGEVVEETALPFDRRRNGMIIGMGAAALVVESQDAARERGLRPICEVLGTKTLNSAFHRTRLDIQHISQLMEDLVAGVELSSGISRDHMASQMMFMSHETYTPARGGSAAAEVNALRRVFGAAADRIIVANTKGFTGHAMGAGIEDVVAVKALETGRVPPVANFKEVDPDLGPLNLSKGGAYPVEYALRLGAGFGSQISMTLMRRLTTKDEARPSPNALGYRYRIVDGNAWNAWLSRMAGYPTADLEVVNRTLRVQDQGVASRPREAAQETPTELAPALRAPTPKPVAESQPTPPAPPAKASPPKAAIPAVSSVSEIEGGGTDVYPLANALIPAAKTDPVKQRILTLVAEKTGYPIDMLDLDLDLEADLGVDTVKQAEVMATVRETYGIERDDKLKLRDFPTLAHVIRFVHDRRPDLAAVVPPSPAADVRPEVRPEIREAATSAPATPATKPSQDGAADSVKERVLALVAEKTGYPVDMLDLGLDLEADLGVDTVKQAEVFATVRETYGIERDDKLKLRDFPTLAHMIRYVHDRRPDLTVAAPPSPEAEVKEETEAFTSVPALMAPMDNPSDPVKARVLALVAEKTGYPVDMLDLGLDLEADLGVDTVKQAEVFATVRETYGIARDDKLKLRDFPTLAHIIRYVHERRPDLALAVPPSPAAEVKEETKPATFAPVPIAAKDDASNPVKERVLALVAEKTGYPKDMLDLDLDLEADLGVDTVKQAEVFAAVRATYNIPRDENLKLRDFPTLARVIQFVYDKRPDLAGAVTSSPAAQEQPQPAVIGAVASTDGDNQIKERVLEIVAEKTGYPKDMLDLELDLEADLGIDTVKQAEMFASVRAEYDIPRDETMKLRDFPTLAHVIKFARDRRGGLAAAPALNTFAVQEIQERKSEGPAAPLSLVQANVQRPTVASLDAANSIPRRVPVPNLRPSLIICKPTGVTLGSGTRVIIMPDKGGVGDALAELLQTMGVYVLRIEDAPEADALTIRINNWLSAGPVQGVYWLPALDNEGSLSDMDLATWRESLRLRVKSLYTTMRALYAQIALPGTFLVSATRLGGQHGYDRGGATAPLGGAVVGFTKAYKRECMEALVKAVDFAPGCATSELAQALVEETLCDPGAMEIGYKNGQRWTVGLQEQSAADGEAGLALNKDTVFLITGAAGSIVSAITADLAAASGGTFYLLDLVPEPDHNNPDLNRLVSDKDGLKRDLFARLKAQGERATPAKVEKELAALERSQAARSAIDAVEAAGGTAHYFSVDLKDTDAVAKVIDQVREGSGRIDVLLHAAGLERSHFLPDKSPREFDLVFDVKSDGWFNLLHAIGEMPLGTTVAFSSIAARFGNGGQADYSAANDLLCKMASNFRTTRPATRAIAIDWTAWGGIGMAARGSIPKMMALAGIDMLPPEAGIPLIRRELTLGGTRGEIVIGQRLGILLNEFDSTGGLATTPLEAVGDIEPASGNPQEALFPDTMPQGPMIGKIASMGLHHGLTIETTLDPKIQPFLYDHQIDGTPVLPGVMGIEAFAEAALWMVPGWHVEAIEEVNFLAPFKFYRNEPRTLTIQAVFYPQGDALTADCRLIGLRPLPNQPEPQLTTHFTARVRLTKQPQPVAVAAPRLNAPADSTMEATDIYRIYFHGPAYQVLERAWRDGDRIVGLMAKSLPSNHHPPELPTLVAPRLIELCFQTAGLSEMSVQGRMGLPLHVHQVCFWPAPELGGAGVLPLEAQGEGAPAMISEVRMYAVVTPDPDHGCFHAEVVDTTGKQYLRLSGYRTVALSSSVDAAPLKVLRAAA